MFGSPHTLLCLWVIFLVFLGCSVYTLRTLAASNEAIAYQTDSFFRALTEAFQDIYANKGSISKDKLEFFKDDRVQRLAQIIDTYTNLKVDMKEGDFACVPNRMADGSVIGPKDDRWIMQIATRLVPFLGKNEAVEQIKAIGKNFVVGHVDLKNAKVRGVFSEIISLLFFPRDALTSGYFTPEELAAITLHEVGHLFTHMEYLDRLIGTNQSIACLLRVLNDTTDDQERTLIFHEYGRAVEMTKEDEEKLVGAKDPLTITMIVANHFEGKIKSDFGLSDYDSVNSEFLADQFSTRCGAGVHIVTGLDKLMKSTYGAYYTDGGVGEHIPRAWILLILAMCVGMLKMAIFIVAMANFPIIGGLIAIMLMVFGADNTDTYDRAHERFDRVRQQNTERLKDRGLAPELRNVLISQNETIDKINETWLDSKFEAEQPDFIQVLAKIIRPKYRAENEFRILQIQLQEIAFNRMFDRAAKLRQI